MVCVKPENILKKKQFSSVRFFEAIIQEQEMILSKPWRKPPRPYNLKVSNFEIKVLSLIQAGPSKVAEAADQVGEQSQQAAEHNPKAEANPHSSIRTLV